MQLKHAEIIIDHSLAKAAELKLNPMTVAVFDKGGNLVAFKKQDGSSNLRQVPHEKTYAIWVRPWSASQAIASGKALGALGMGTDSRNLAKVSDV